MKVVLLNGSPRRNGNTHDMLHDLIEEFHNLDVETQYFTIGTKCIHGCIACGKCDETHRCIFKDDCVNDIIEAMETADGFVVGSPVYPPIQRRPPLQTNIFVKRRDEFEQTTRKRHNKHITTQTKNERGRHGQKHRKKAPDLSGRKAKAVL